MGSSRRPSVELPSVARLALLRLVPNVGAGMEVLLVPSVLRVGGANPPFRLLGVAIRGGPQSEWGFERAEKKEGVAIGRVGGKSDFRSLCAMAEETKGQPTIQEGPQCR